MARRTDKYTLKIMKFKVATKIKNICTQNKLLISRVGNPLNPRIPLKD